MATMKKMLLAVMLIMGLGFAGSALAATLNKTRAAAERGNAQAQYQLGDMYDEGQGVKQDKAQALIWYRKACRAGVRASPIHPRSDVL
jgi:TPR repeat protein